VTIMLIGMKTKLILIIWKLNGVCSSAKFKNIGPKGNNSIK
jgi:hypothetical protein